MEQEVVTSGIETSDLERELYAESPERTDVTKDKSFWQKLSDLYFQPKSFERSGKLYESLGVKWFRKYCPNGGSFWTKRGQSSMVKGRTKENLESFIWLTKILEGVHSFGFLPFYTTMTAIDLADKDYVGAGIWTVLNLGLNLYPIMSQRYNRNKATQMLESLEERETKEMPAPYK